MKNLTKLAPVAFLFFALFFSAFTTQAQNIYFADIHLKTVLLANSQVNINGDNEIQKSEATVFASTLDISNAGIYDLTGIEYFTNMTALNCSNNQIQFMNLTSNTSLFTLNCNNNALQEINLVTLTELISLNISNNKLTELDLTNNGLLKRLNCSYNELNAIDVHANPELLMLVCFNNNISSLDVSNNNQLIVLDCSNNNLTNLNVANTNNSNMVPTSFNAQNNDLNCIKVDDKSFSDQNWSSSIDANSFFSNTCTVTVPSITAYADILTIFPNPASKKVTITFGDNNSNVSMKIFNSAGAVVMQEKYQDRKSVTLDLELNAGVYLVAVDKGDGNIETHKLLKK
jgi:Leucine-rich repeat (LRR) protein